METLTITVILGISLFVMAYLAFKNKTHRERNKRLKKRNYELQELNDKLVIENSNMMFAYSKTKTKYDELVNELKNVKTSPTKTQIDYANDKG